MRSRPRWQRPVPLASLGFAVTVLVAVGIGYGFSAASLTRSPVLMGLILSTTSLGIVLPVLKERELTVTAYGQTVLVSAVISDFATLLLLSIVIAVVSRGAGPQLLLFTLLLGAFAIAAKVGQWVRRVTFMARVIDELSHATAQIQVRGAFALMVAWVVLADWLGVEVILGAFLAGATISLSSRSHESSLRGKLDAIGYGFFIPIFFVTVGARFDVGALLGSPRGLLLVPLMIVAAYGVEVVANLALRSSSFSSRETIAASLDLVITTVVDHRRVVHRARSGDHLASGQLGDHSGGDRDQHAVAPPLLGGAAAAKGGEAGRCDRARYRAAGDAAGRASASGWRAGDIFGASPGPAQEAGGVRLSRGDGQALRHRGAGAGWSDDCASVGGRFERD